MEIRDIFARNLRRARKAKGFSQEELADRARVDRTYISDLERSVYAVSLEVLDRIAVALEVEAPELLVKPPGPAQTKNRQTS